MAKTDSALEYKAESTSGDGAISNNDDKPNGSGSWARTARGHCPLGIFRRRPGQLAVGQNQAETRSLPLCRGSAGISGPGADRRNVARVDSAPRSLHPCPPHVRTQAGRLLEASIACDPRPHRRSHARDRIAVSSQTRQAPLLPLHGIPHGPLVGRQPLEPSHRGVVSRGVRRVRHRSRRGSRERV